MVRKALNLPRRKQLFTTPHQVEMKRIMDFADQRQCGTFVNSEEADKARKLYETLESLNREISEHLNSIYLKKNYT